MSPPKCPSPPPPRRRLPNELLYELVHCLPMPIRPEKRRAQLQNAFQHMPLGVYIASATEKYEKEQHRISILRIMEILREALARLERAIADEEAKPDSEQQRHNLERMYQDLQRMLSRWDQQVQQRTTAAAATSAGNDDRMARLARQQQGHGIVLDNIGGGGSVAAGHAEHDEVVTGVAGQEDRAISAEGQVQDEHHVVLEEDEEMPNSRGADQQPSSSAQAEQPQQSKLRLFREINLQQLQADVLVNFCASDILSGDEIFLNVHELAGTELKNFCTQFYQALTIGNCRLSDSYGLTNFKKIAHSIFPRPAAPIMQEDGQMMIDLDEHLLVGFGIMQCYRNVLDISIHDGHSSMVFIHPSSYDHHYVAKLAVAMLIHWLHHSPIAHKLDFVAIACPNEQIAQYYMDLVVELPQQGLAEFLSFYHSSALYSYLVDSFGTAKHFEEPTDENGEGAEELSKRRPYCVGSIGHRDKNKPLAECDQMQAELQMFGREIPMKPMENNYPEPYMGLNEEPSLSENQQMLKHQGAKRCFEVSNLAIHPTEQILRLPPTNPPMLDGHSNLNQFCLERYGFDQQYIHDNLDEVFERLFHSSEGLHLQLSSKLNRTILLLEEEQTGTGMVRQYCMGGKYRKGETVYFRCTRCDSLMKNTHDEYRPNLTVKDGFIEGDRFPAHHPQCFPMTKEHIILQQLRRQARLQMVQLNAMTQRDIPTSVGQMPLDAIPSTSTMPPASLTYDGAYDGGPQPPKRNCNSAARRAEMSGN